MNAEKSFAFPFEDKEWISKLGLWAIIGMIPILNFAWYGYLVGIIRNVMSNDREPLPVWDDLGHKFNEGLILFGAGFVYALPVLIALGVPLAITASSGLFSGISEMQDFNRIMVETGGILFFSLLCVMLFYGLALSILYPAILVLFAREGTFASCFRPREALALISKHAGPFFTAWALSLVASLGAGLLVGFVNLVVGFVPCTGWVIGLALSLVSGVYASAVYAHLFGQFGRVAFGQNELIPSAPPGTAV